ncbi:unnamed protein product, partial [Brassica oleracea]
DISNINYHINLNLKLQWRIKQKGFIRHRGRTRRNEAERIYWMDCADNVRINAPKGLRVRVIATSLHFKKIGDTLSYQVIFSSSTSTLKEVRSL